MASELPDPEAPGQMQDTDDHEVYVKFADLDEGLED